MRTIDLSISCIGSRIGKTLTVVRVSGATAGRCDSPLRLGDTSDSPPVSDCPCVHSDWHRATVLSKLYWVTHVTVLPLETVLVLTL